MRSRIAIDFGTSRTKVAYIPGPGRAAELMRFAADGVDRSYVPSIFYLPKDGGPALFGHEAEAMLEEDPAGVLDDLKRRLREPRRRANGREASPQSLLTLLFTDLRRRAGEDLPVFRDRAPSEVVLTVPVGFGPFQRDLLRNAALAAGFEEVIGPIDEPIAAARGWLFDAGSSTEAMVVLDCGGGTVDWAYLRRDDAGRFRVVVECPPSGLERLGGYDVDQGLLELVERKLSEAGVDSAEFGIARRARLRDRLRRLKETLRRGPEDAIGVRVGDQRVELERREIEDVIREQFVARVCDGLAGYLRQIEALVGDDRPSVLMVGGSSRLAGLEAAIKALGCEVVDWDRSDFGAAVGALREDAIPRTVSAQRTTDEVEPLFHGRGNVTSRSSASSQASTPAPPVQAATDEIAEIAEKEASLALKMDRPELALLLALSGWSRVADRQGPHKEGLLELIAAAAARRGPLARFEVANCEAAFFGNSDDEVFGSSNHRMRRLGWPTPDQAAWGQAPPGVFVNKVRDSSEIVIWGRHCVSSFDLDRFARSHQDHNIKEFINTVDVSPDGRRALLGTSEGVFQINLQTGEELAKRPVKVDGDLEGVAAYCSTGRYFLAAFADGCAWEWDSADGEATGRCYGSGQLLSAVQYSHGDSLVITTSDGGIVQVWDRKDFRPLSAPMAHAGSVRTLLVPEEGDDLVTLGQDGVVRFWDLRTGAPRGLELAMASPIMLVARSGDGAVVATAANGDGVQLWHAGTGARIGPPLQPRQPLKSLCFSPSCKLLLVATPEGAELWDVTRARLSGDDLVCYICQDEVAPLRTFSAAERHASLIADLPQDPSEVCRQHFATR
jgi:hypothetical protein